MCRVRGYDCQLDLVDALKENTEDWGCFWLHVMLTKIKCTGRETYVPMQRAVPALPVTHTVHSGPRRAGHWGTQRACPPLLTLHLLLCIPARLYASQMPPPGNRGPALLCASYLQLDRSSQMKLSPIPPNPFPLRGSLPGKWTVGILSLLGHFPLSSPNPYQDQLTPFLRSYPFLPSPLPPPEPVRQIL